MGGVMRIWGCAFYLLLISFDEFLLKNLVESQSMNRVRPAEAACKKYRKMATDLGLTRVQSSDEYLVNLGEFPYLVAVGLLDTSSEDRPYNRGGVLISEKHVLATSFSVSTFSGRIPIQVMLGSMDPRNETQPEGMQRIRISRIIKYPQYDRKFEYGNIAILELKNPVQFTIHVQPICLMTEPLTDRTEGANGSLVIASWSSEYWDSNNGPVTQIKITNQKFVAKDECSNFYDARLPRIPNGLDDDMICLARSTDDVKIRDSCWGRTGAPVLMPFNESLFLVGLTSFHYKCPSKNPSVAVSTYKYLNWIEDQVWPDVAR